LERGGRQRDGKEDGVGEGLGTGDWALWKKETRFTTECTEGPGEEEKRRGEQKRRDLD
jgi:hypothetical protein